MGTSFPAAIRAILSCGRVTPAAAAAVEASADTAFGAVRCIAAQGIGGSTEGLAGLPEALARTMEQLVSQLDVVTHTLQSLESRIGVTELAIAELAQLVVTR